MIQFYAFNWPISYGAHYLSCFDLPDTFLCELLCNSTPPQLLLYTVCCFWLTEINVTDTCSAMVCIWGYLLLSALFLPSVKAHGRAGSFRNTTILPYWLYYSGHFWHFLWHFLLPLISSLPHFKSHSTCVVTDHNRCKIAAKSTQDSTLIFVVLLKKMYHIHEGELDSHCLKAFCPCYEPNFGLWCFSPKARAFSSL